MNTVSFDDFSEKSIDRASKLLAGIPNGANRAVSSALKRAAQHGLTVGMKIVSEEYTIGQNVLKARTQTLNTVIKESGGTMSVSVGYRGNVIPLIQFDTRVNKNGQVFTRVLRSSTRQELKHAFVATVNGHTGIYEREGLERLPIKELFGPSAVQAFYARESTVDKMGEEITDAYDKRIEHEITRLLNGWGVRK